MKSASIYKFNNGKIILHPKNRIKDGPSYASNPYLIEFNLSKIEIAKKLLEVLEFSLDNAPISLNWKVLKKKYLIEMGIKDLKMLHNGSVYVSVYTINDRYNICPFINKGSKIGFIGLKDKIEIPKSSSIEYLADKLEEAFIKCHREF